MFTSEPSLAQRIERMIGDVAIVDTRSYLIAGETHAGDLAALLFASPVHQVLRGVGLPVAAFDPDRPADERVLATLPYLRQIRTTAAGWCLFRIFRDLYDFDDPHLTEANYRGLFDRVAAAAQDPDRTRHVLRDRARLGRVVAPLTTPAAESAAGPAPDVIVHRLDIVAADPGDEAPQVVRSQVFEELDRGIEGTVKFAALAARLDLDHPVHAAVLEWHHLHRAPLQVMLDPAAADPFDRIWAALKRYPDIRLGLGTWWRMLSTPTDPSERVAALAGLHSGVFADGPMNLAVGPSELERLVRSRIEQAGVTKIGGFASGASSAEWVYGALQLTRKATASALAQAVASGFFEEDEIRWCLALARGFVNLVG